MKIILTHLTMLLSLVKRCKPKTEDEKFYLTALAQDLQTRINGCKFLIEQTEMLSETNKGVK